MPWLYTDPANLDYAQVDEPIRSLVREINASSWLRTEESCAGHPGPRAGGPLEPPFIWGEDLYLRLVLLRGAPVRALLRLVEECRGGLRLIPHAWASLSYDRTDETGTHWFFTSSYDRHLDNREAAVAGVLEAFRAAAAWLDEHPGEG